MARIGDINDRWALEQRRLRGCLYDVGACLCPSAPYEFEGCKARIDNQPEHPAVPAIRVCPPNLNPDHVNEPETENTP